MSIKQSTRREKVLQRFAVIYVAARVTADVIRQ